MRFALMEGKMALIEIMKKYTFVRAPETEVSSSVTVLQLVGCYFCRSHSVAYFSSFHSSHLRLGEETAYASPLRGVPSTVRAN